ncbi:uncharacterized protein [Rutidosis leptorrhynchoides]|uniref:uncharacterized protein n=1 Tax=Rutidosis leptorrhynchoides TaxID=125765 RepID=UPI003A99F665
MASCEYFLAIRGKWCGSGHETIIVNVYGPHKDVKKIEMWIRLENLISNYDSAWVLCGDFNEIEIPINGKRFTRISVDGTKFSKLDRVLVNDNFLKLWKDLSVIALERKESDHCPLLLHDKNIDFGLKPFKCFDEWLKKEGVDKVIQDAWSKPVNISKKDCLFGDKLKNVKNELKAWSKIEFGDLENEILVLKEKSIRLEALA